MVDFRAAIQEDKVFRGVDDGPPTATAVAMRDPFDLERVKARFADYRPVLDDMKAKAAAVTVTNQESASVATSMASQAKRLAKQIEDQRKAIVEAPNAFVKGANTLAKSFSEPLSEIDRLLVGKINAYQREQERIRMEQERKAREEAEALRKKLEEDQKKEQARLDAEAKAKGTEPAQAPPPIVPEIIIPQAKTITRTEDGSASIRKVWTWKLLDFAKLPDEYKRVDEVKLNQAVKAGLREIAGVEIFEDQKTVIRT